MVKKKIMFFVLFIKVILPRVQSIGQLIGKFLIDNRYLDKKFSELFR